MIWRGSENASRAQKEPEKELKVVELSHSKFPTRNVKGFPQDEARLKRLWARLVLLPVANLHRRILRPLPQNANSDPTLIVLKREQNVNVRGTGQIPLA